MPNHRATKSWQRRFVVLDRDGTIIEERHYLSRPEQVELIPGAIAGLRSLAEMGLGLVVITNQSGIGRGYFDQTALEVVHQRMCQLLESEGIQLQGIYFCPHTPQENCLCRKPGTGLLELAANELTFDPGVSFVIGDKSSDIELGHRVGATTFLVTTGYGAQTAQENTTTATYTMAGLPDAANVIQGLLQPAQRV